MIIAEEKALRLQHRIITIEAFISDLVQLGVTKSFSIDQAFRKLSIVIHINY